MLGNASSSSVVSKKTITKARVPDNTYNKCSKNTSLDNSSEKNYFFGSSPLALPSLALPTTSAGAVSTGPITISKGNAVPPSQLNNRLDRLEALIMSQHDENNNFKDMIIDTLSLVPPGHDDAPEHMSEQTYNNEMDIDPIDDDFFPLAQQAQPSLLQNSITQVDSDAFQDSTVQITFIFIDFRVCDFAFAFKTQNAPCVSRFKRVLFSDRFQFAF